MTKMDDGLVEKLDDLIASVNGKDGFAREAALAEVGALVRSNRILILTALRAQSDAEVERDRLLAAVEEWAFRYYWQAEGMPTEGARVHARALVAEYKTRQAIERGEHRKD